MNDDKHTEQSSLSNSPHQSPLLLPLQSQEKSPTLQPLKLESQISPSTKSLTALQLKLTRDKNFSRKITLHTFFSYIILALEMERASSISIARISPDKVQHLIEYMIEHHTESESVRIYLQTLVDTGVVKNLIESVIEFNKDQTEAFNKLLTEEQIELELTSIQQETRSTATPATTPATTTATPASATQTPQESLATRIRNFFKRCCCCCSRRRAQRRPTEASVTVTVTVDAPIPIPMSEMNQNQNQNNEEETPQSKQIKNDEETLANTDTSMTN